MKKFLLISEDGRVLMLADSYDLACNMLRVYELVYHQAVYIQSVACQTEMPEWASKVLEQL